jgi:hypothetical protein
MATKKTNVLDAVLEQYEKAKQGGNTNKMSQEERMKKYFAAILPQNKNTGSKRIRILPTNDGSSPFKEVWFHEVQVDGKWVKLYDPGQNDNEKSPLNDVYDELMSTGKASDKELAKQYKARKFYIVKVVDRDAEDEGVKFWRFKHNYKNEGVLDKIIPIWRAKGDITDPEKGRDLIIEMAEAKTPKGKEYTVIQTIMQDDVSVLHDDKELAKSWTEDELTWADVYSKKPTEYLEAIANGQTPKWSSELGKYTYGDNDEGEVVFGGSKSKTTHDDPQADAEPDDEMPF